jgi:hypothetical protein
MHHALIFLDYKGDVPTNDERTRVENAVRTVENAYEWGVENQSPVGGPVLNEGLLFAIGYSQYFFESAYGERPQRPAMNAEELVEELNALGGLDSDTTPDTYDAFVYLTSDLANVVLGAEEALFNNVNEANGSRFTAVSTVSLRRRNAGRGSSVGERSPESRAARELREDRRRRGFQRESRSRNLAAVHGIQVRIRRQPAS